MRPDSEQAIGENTMFKRILCVAVMLMMLAVLGCGDDIKTDRKVEIKDVPIGEPQPVID
jgi:hypothetical protein